jgi:hypothetical protein
VIAGPHNTSISTWRQCLIPKGGDGRHAAAAAMKEQGENGFMTSNDR